MDELLLTKLSPCWSYTALLFCCRVLPHIYSDVKILDLTQILFTEGNIIFSITYFSLLVNFFLFCILEVAFIIIVHVVKTLQFYT